MARVFQAHLTSCIGEDTDCRCVCPCHEWPMVVLCLGTETRVYGTFTKRDDVDRFLDTHCDEDWGCDNNTPKDGHGVEKIR